MPSMFPSSTPHPDDINRRYRPSQRDLTGVPRSITWGRGLLVATAILMVFSGLLLVTATPPEHLEVDPEAVRTVRRNLVFVGVVDLVAGIMVALLSPQLRRGSRSSRRWLLGVIVLAALVNLLSFVVLREPLSLALITALLMVSGVVMFQPSATAYVNRMNE